MTEKTFASLGLKPSTLDRLRKLGLERPTPIQAAAIPVALTGADVIGLAQTGTGKTLAFGLPLRERLQPGQRALIILPTRELAIQVDEWMVKLGLRTALLIGGQPMPKQIRQIAADPQVVVGTPGRLKDHLYSGSLRLDGVTTVVLDEADRMLDMGFAPAIRFILARAPKARQTMMFSATLPTEIEGLASEYLRDPVRVEVARPGTTAEGVAQELLVLDPTTRTDMLRDVLAEESGSVLVFVRTRHGARKIARQVKAMGHEAGELHSDRTLPQRRAALDAFKAGRSRVLVATDIAARGIDVQGIGLVLNYELPDQLEDYVHRIGRTGRAGRSGRALTFVAPDQAKDVHDLERMVGAPIARSRRSTAELPAWPPRREARPAPRARMASAGRDVRKRR